MLYIYAVDEIKAKPYTVTMTIETLLIFSPCIGSDVFALFFVILMISQAFEWKFRWILLYLLYCFSLLGW